MRVAEEKCLGIVGHKISNFPMCWNVMQSYLLKPHSGLSKLTGVLLPFRVLAGVLCVGDVVFVVLPQLFNRGKTRAWWWSRFKEPR